MRHPPDAAFGLGIEALSVYRLRQGAGSPPAWQGLGAATPSGVNFLTSSASEPALAFAPDGRGFLAYRYGGGLANGCIRVQAYAPGSDSWTDNVGNLCGQTSQANSPVVATDPDGAPYVAYRWVQGGGCAALRMHWVHGMDVCHGPSASSKAWGQRGSQ